MQRQSADDVIYNALVDAARAGKRCPTNGELAGLIGASSVGTPVRVLARLSAAGKIVVTSGQTSRVVDIPELRLGTAGLLPAKHWREKQGRPLSTHVRPARTEALDIHRVPCAAPPRHRRTMREMRLTDDEIAARVVSRDPCPLCGVRGDIGCKHTRLSHA